MAFPFRALALGALMLAAPADADSGQDKPAAGFRIDDPAYAPLIALQKVADAADAASSQTATPTQRAASRALQDAAIKVRVGPLHLPHPLAGYALSQLAIDDQEDGNETAALAEATEALTLLRPFRDSYPDPYIQAISTIGFLQSDLGKPSEAATALAEGADWEEQRFATLPPAERTKDAYTAKSNIDFAYAQTLLTLGQADKGAAYQKLSMETRRTGYGPDDPDTISATYQYAIALFKAGRKAEAEEYGRLAVRTAIDHVDPANPVYARSLEALGLILVRVGRRSESVDYFLRAADLKRRYGGADTINFFFTLNNLADTLVQLERYGEARDLGIEAAKGFAGKEGEHSAKLARARAVIGVAEAADARLDEAAADLGSALAIARADDPKEQLTSPRVLPALIVADMDLGRTAAAQALAAGYAADVRANTPAPFGLANADLLQAYVGSAPGSAAAARRLIAAIRGDRVLAASGELPQEQRTALDLVLRVAVRTDDAPLALDAMVILAGSRLAQANRLVADRIAGADPALATHIRGQQDATQRLRDADTAFLKAQASGDGMPAARRMRDDAAAALDTIQAALARDYPRWAEVSGAADPDLAALQRSLRADEGVLAAIPAFDGVYTLTVTRRAAIVRRAPLGRAAIVALVGRVRDSLPRGGVDTVAAQTLYRQFFPAADAAVLRGVTSLRLVPAGPLASLPFATLIGPSKETDGATPYLIRRFALEIASSFVPGPPAGRGTADAGGGGQFLGVGAPTPFGDASTKPTAVLSTAAYFRGATVDGAALAGLPPLPGSAAELRAVARGFGLARSRLLIGDDASEARLRGMDLRPYSTLLFATHGLVSGEMEGVAEPALVLARPRAGDAGDGLLTASEVALLTLDADWVILSACNTASGGAAGAPAYSGLAQAFRYAGARTLLLSHWPVRDDAASFVTIHTIANARKGMRRDMALRQAMLTLMASRTIPDAADPYIWAPYILVGS